MVVFVAISKERLFWRFFVNFVSSISSIKRVLNRRIYSDFTSCSSFVFHILKIVDLIVEKCFDFLVEKQCFILFFFFILLRV